MPYLLLATSIALAVINNALYHKLSDEKESYNQFLFTAVSSLVWLIILLPNKNIVNINKAEVLFGVIYGVAQAMFLFFKMKAMSNGPVSITSVVSNCSMLLTVILGVFLFDERVSVMQMLGLCMIILSVFFCVDPKSGLEMTLKWKIYCVIFFIFAASVGIIFKFFAASAGNGNNMMLIAAVTMIMILIVLSKLSRREFKLSKKQMIIAILSGVVSCGYNRINVFLTGTLPSVVFFPIFNGSIVLLATIVGWMFFKERLSLKQITGVGTGIISIVLLSGVF